MTDKLALWLAHELDERGWTNRQLARRAGISHTTVNNVVNGITSPTLDFCRAIAGPLKVPYEALLQMAGLLPRIPESRVREFDTIAEQLAALPDGPIREEAMAAIRAIAESARRRTMEREEQGG